MIDPELLKIICCPQCKGELELQQQEFLLCRQCRLKYPIKDDIPVLLVEEAEKIDSP